MKLKVVNTYPTKEVFLPSRNMFYPNLDESFKFEIRGMTVQEQKMLLQMNNNNIDETILKIVRNCVINYDISTLNLLIIDRDYLLYEIRKLTYGNDINIEYSCQNCGTQNSFVFDLNDLEVQYIDDDILDKLKYRSQYLINEETGEPVLIQFFLPTVKSLNEINVLTRKNKDMTIYQTIVSNIYSIDGEPVDFNTKRELFDYFIQLPAEEVMKMMKVLQHNYGIQQTTKHSCENCGTENEIPVLNIDFFFPVK